MGYELFGNPPKSAEMHRKAGIKAETKTRVNMKSGFANESHRAGRWFVGMRCEHTQNVGTLVHWVHNEFVRKRT